MHVAWQVPYKRHMGSHGSDRLGGPGADFLRVVAFCPMAWIHCFVAGAILWRDGIERSLDLARGHRVCTQLSIYIYIYIYIYVKDVSQNYFVFEVVKFKS